MATKNEPFAIEGTNDPNYLGYSSRISPEPPSQAWGTLFAGLGNLAVAGAKGYEDVRHIAIDKKAEADVDKIQEPYTNISGPEAETLATFRVKGVGEAGETSAPAGSLFTSPGTGQIDKDLDYPGAAGDGPANPVVKQELSKIERMYQGYSSGAVSPTKLYLDYVSTIKTLKAQYPGDRAYIDAKMHQLTGVHSANALIHALWSDFQAAGASAGSAVNKNLSYLHQNEKYLGASSDDPNGMSLQIAQAYATSNNQEGMRRVEQHVAAQKTAEFRREQARHNLDDELKAGQVDAKRGSAALAGDLSSIVPQKIAAWRFGANGISGQDIPRMLEMIQTKQLIKDPRTGEMVPANSPQNVAAMQAILTKHVEDVTQGIRDYVDKPQFAPDPKTGQPTKSYRQIINDDALVEQRIKFATSKLTDMKTAIGAGDWNVANAESKLLEAQNTNAGLQLLRDESLQRLGGVATAIKSAEIQKLIAEKLLLDPGGKLLPAVKQSLNYGRFRDVVSGLYPDQGLDKILTDHKSVSPYEKPTKEYIESSIKDIHFVINSKTATVEQKVNAAKFITHPNTSRFFAQFNESAQTRLFAMIASPEISQKMADLGKSNPQVWNDYVQWAGRTVPDIFQQEIGLLKSYHPQGVNPEIKYDPNTSQIVISQGKLLGHKFRRVKETADRLNLGLSSFSKIMELNKTDKSELPRLLAEWGLPGPQGLDTQEQPASTPPKATEKAPGALKLTPGEEGTGGGLKRTEGAVNPGKSVMGFARLKQGTPEDISAFLTKDKSSPHVDKLQPEFKGSLSKMFQAMPPDLQKGVKIYSGARTTERQAELFAAAVEKYGSEKAARKWVAPPGFSPHERGEAADLKFASPAVKQWIHANAEKFGLTFRMSHEGWHIEPIRQ